MRRSVVITKATTPAAVDNGSVGLTGVAGALSAGSVAVSGAAWNLPATISVQQDGVVGLRQYALNAGAHTISVSGLPTGVTYNSGLEQLEGASTGTASATVTFTLTLGAITVVDTATVSLYEPGSYPAGYYPSVYPLELVSPRAAGSFPSAESGTPAMPSGHRIFKAYPGIEYNIRAVVIGGAYPYTFSLSNAPAGMTIDSRTGEISWPNPTANATPTITVTDMDGTQRSSSWAIEVTTTGFKFVDATSGSNANAGTFSAPWQTLDKVQDSASANDICYFRFGTYDLRNATITDEGGVNFKRMGFDCVQWVAYPGEEPTLDLMENDASANPGPGQEGFVSSASRLYLDGFHITRVRQKAFLLTPSHYSHARNCRITNSNPSDTSYDGSNPGIFSTNASVNNPMYYFCIQDCTQTQDPVTSNGPELIKTYSLWKPIVEDCTVDGVGGIGDWKDSIRRWTIRGCRQLNVVRAAPFGNGNDRDVPNTTDNWSGEWCYNYTVASRGIEVACELNQDGIAQDVYSYRNTLVGHLRVRGTVDTSDGPFTFNGNVIINSDSGNTFPYIDTSLAVLNDSSRIVAPIGAGLGENLAGNAAAGIIDGSGNLAGSYRATYLNYRGHEIAES